ncbi:MAG: LPS-assembly protein LptD [Zoogloeaceae bacterium]|jgi:LPS-assembly protein|nr:LPS-assembly protein LptD [Zoogloeaceae bacterium]
MTGFSRRPLAALIACLFWGGLSVGNVARAAPPAGAPSGEAPAGSAAWFSTTPAALPSLTIPATADRQAAPAHELPPPPEAGQVPPTHNARPKKKRTPQPSFLTADHIEGQTDESTHAQGHVELHKDDALMQADQLIYRPLEDEIEAQGQVRLTQAGAEVSGPYLKLQLASQIGYFDQAQYTISRMVASSGYDHTPTPGLAIPLPALPPRQSTAYGEATRINFEGENQFRIEDGNYSTCKPDQDNRKDWYAQSSEIKLDYDQNAGTASHATVYFKDTPILYAPYLAFPLNNQRKSGLLAPTFSSSTRTGFDLAIPYYWNIAPNYDATITPRAMTKRGMQLGAELRYLDHYTESEFQFEHMMKDKAQGDRRYAYSLTHRQTLGRGFSTYIDWNGVSDDEYFTDLSSRVVKTSQRQLPRQFILNYGREWWSAQLQTLRYQTLNPGKADAVDAPYFLAPRLSFNARTPDWHGLEGQMFGQYTRFTHPSWEEGKRTVLYPQLSFSHIRPGYYIQPKIGLHSTYYQLSQRAAGLPTSLNRSLPIFSLDMGMTFEREAMLAGNRWIQTLEPRLYYLNIPYKNQSRYPVFDTSLADFNFAQIFSENRFSGYDLVNNANQLTAALTTRLIDPASGAERLKAMVGQRYYFTDLKVGLHDRAYFNDAGDEKLQKSRSSDFLAAFTGQVAPKTYVDMALEYDFDARKTARFTFGARYQPAHGQVLSASYRYNKGSVADFRDTMDQIDLAGQWNLSGRWHAVGRYNYALDSSRLVEGIAGLEYNAGCWVGRLVVQRLETTAGDPNTSFFFQLELNDFGQVGSNPIQMLRRSVPGYSKINELPSHAAPSGSLLTSE